MRSGAEELDQFLANASSEARAEYRRRLEASAEKAVRPFKELERVVQRLADEYQRQVLKERESLKRNLGTCASQAIFSQGF